MAKDFSRSFYESAAWMKCRNSYIAYRRGVDGGMCELCHDVPGYEVHHRKELTPTNINDPNITMGFDNLQFLCHNCHTRVHHGRKDAAENLVEMIFSPDGEPIATPPVESGAKDRLGTACPLHFNESAKNFK